MLRNYDGITLVSLIITIIVLLILAGISIQLSVGENGVVSKSLDATEDYDKQTEREALLMHLTRFITTEGDESEKIGEQNFKDKMLYNGKSWDTSFNLDTNWSLVERKKTQIPNYGIAQYSWLINYETGDIIAIDGTKVTVLGYKVKDFV